jgi:phosphatidylglycerophosphate synthase
VTKTQAILYVPSDTPEAMTLATKKVAGVPLIVRGIMTLVAAGIEHCTLLIAATQRGTIEQFLARYDDRRLPTIEMIAYDEPYRVSPPIVRHIADGAAERILLINANLLFERDLVAALRRAPLERGGVIAASVGAHLLPALDVSRSAWAGLEAFTALAARSIESCVARLAESAQAAMASLPAGGNAFLLRRLSDRAVAETFLAEAIRHATPGPIARHLNKRISLPISLLLCKLWVSPHAITVVNIVIGLFSGVFVADGKHYDSILFGALLFQIASIVDGCDGEVAKLTFRCSKFGQYIDSLSDNLSLGSFMTGLIAGFWRQTHSPIAFYSGAIMLASTAVTLFWMIRYLARHTQSASLATYDKEYLSHLSQGPQWLLAFIRFGKYTLKKDVFSFLFLAFAVAGVLYWVLFIAAFDTTAAALTLTYLNLRPQPASAMALRAEEEGSAA